MTTSIDDIRLEQSAHGALMIYDANGRHTETRFRLWAPAIPVLRLFDDKGGSEDYQMEDCGASSTGTARAGWSELVLPAGKAPEGVRYQFGFENKDHPEGMHFIPDWVSYGLDGDVNTGKSIVTDIRPLESERGRKGLPWHKVRFYNLHIGTDTPHGDFASIDVQLDEAEALGCNTIEAVNFGAWHGRHNWGFDCVQPFCPAQAYGTLADFKEMLRNVHDRGMNFSVQLVPNHFGPIGNFIEQYAPDFFFGDTGWGKGINFAHPDVRLYFRQLARFYTQLGADGFRFDATHAVKDESSKHIMEQIHDDVYEIAKAEKRHVHIVLENQNDSTFQFLGDPKGERIRARGVWADSPMNAERAAIGGVYLDTSYFKPYFRDRGPEAKMDGEADVRNVLESIKETMETGGYNIFDGSPGRAEGIGKVYEHLAYDPISAVLCIQNHDHDGNTPDGKGIEFVIRGDKRYWLDRLKSYAAFGILQPSIPFLWSHFGRNTPFPFFHDMPELIEEKMLGRQKELLGMGIDPKEIIEKSVPPYAASTFESARLYHPDGSLKAAMDPELKRYIRELMDYRGKYIEPYLDPKHGQLERPTVEIIGDGYGIYASWNLHGHKHELVFNYRDEMMDVPQMGIVVGPWGHAMRTDDTPMTLEKKASTRAALNGGMDKKPTLGI